jgi:PqqD family protein of HPr-rel-A system
MARIKPKAREDLTVVELDGEAVIFDTETGELHHLNPPATIVFRLCDGATTMNEMSDDIAEVLGLPNDDVERQVRTTVRQFRKADLLV